MSWINLEEYQRLKAIEEGYTSDPKPTPDPPPDEMILDENQSWDYPNAR